MLLNPAGNVVSYFGSYFSGSLLDVCLEEQRHTIFELEFFPVVVALRAWSKFIMGKLVSYYLDNDAAISTFIRASASTSLSITLVAHYVDLNTNAFSPIGLQSCQSQQPSKSTIPLRFSPICLRDAERFELVLPEHLSQWGINESTGALTLEKHELLSQSSNMDRQHEPIRHHSFEAGITASISKLPRQCKPGR